MDHIAIVLFRLIGEFALASLFIYIGTSTARKFNRENGEYRHWCKHRPIGNEGTALAILKRRENYTRRERQITVMITAFILTVVVMTQVAFDGKQLFNHPEQEDVKFVILSVSWAVAFLGLVGSVFDISMYIVCRKNFRKEQRALPDVESKWWYDRNWPAYNRGQTLHANRAVFLFSIGWFALLAALQLSFNIAGK